jgi:hypothetical protein
MRTARQGKPAQLSSAELAKIRGVLDRGAVVAGFDNDLWTLARIAQVIERATGVAHHPGHMWRILKAMRWSLQRPARKAIERDEAKIARWVAEDWPQLVQTPDAQSLAVFHRRIGTGVKLTPPVRRTWAPRGRMPVLRLPYRRGKQISMCGLVAYRPGQDGHDEPAAWMGFDLLEGAYDTRQCIRVLDGLGSQLGTSRSPSSGTTSAPITRATCTPGRPPSRGWRWSTCRRTRRS